MTRVMHRVLVLALCALASPALADEADDLVDAFVTGEDKTTKKILQETKQEYQMKGAEIESQKARNRKRVEGADLEHREITEKEAAFDRILQPGAAASWEEIPEAMTLKLGGGHVRGAEACWGGPVGAGGDLARATGENAGRAERLGRKLNDSEETNRAEARRTQLEIVERRKHAESEARTKRSSQDLSSAERERLASTARAQEEGDNQRRKDRSSSYDAGVRYEKMAEKCAAILDVNADALERWLAGYRNCQARLASVERDELPDLEAVTTIASVAFTRQFGLVKANLGGEDLLSEDGGLGRFLGCVKTVMPNSTMLKEVKRGIPDITILKSKAMKLRASRLHGRWFPSLPAYEWALDIERKKRRGTPVSNADLVRHHNIVRRMKLYDPLYRDFTANGR